MDNFGAMGEVPSHPELLDALALRFQALDWSVKDLIREIMLSRSYALSSVSDPASERLDPGVDLFWKAERRRHDAETLRDAMLFISGELDLSMGGSTIRANTKSEFGYKFASTRRSVYVPVFRNALHEIFAAFDFADPNLSSGTRTTSTLPTQALYMMNSAFIAERSKKAAQRLLDDAPEAEARIRLAYRRTLGRDPRPRERALALGFLEGREGELDAWAAFQQSLFGCLDFRYLN